ncbi:hypothetical protein PC128_g1479 [Phytophthora cactorum]|nr:hypothetical protein PC128_g1479 [Phytophthora cactorum]
MAPPKPAGKGSRSTPTALASLDPGLRGRSPVHPCIRAQALNSGSHPDCPPAGCDRGTRWSADRARRSSTGSTGFNRHPISEPDAYPSIRDLESRLDHVSLQRDYLQQSNDHLFQEVRLAGSEIYGLRTRMCDQEQELADASATNAIGVEPPALVIGAALQPRGCRHQRYIWSIHGGSTRGSTYRGSPPADQDSAPPDQASRDLAQARSEVTWLSHDLRVARESIATLTTERDQAQHDRSNVTAECNRLQLQISDLEVERDNAITEWDVATRKQTEVKSSIRDLSDKLKTARDAADTLSRQVSESKVVTINWPPIMIGHFASATKPFVGWQLWPRQLVGRSAYLGCDRSRCLLLGCLVMDRNRQLLPRARLIKRPLDMRSRPPVLPITDQVPPPPHRLQLPPLNPPLLVQDHRAACRPDSSKASSKRFYLFGYAIVSDPETATCTSCRGRPRH